MCVYVHTYVGRGWYVGYKERMWSEEYSTPEEDTSSSYILARCQEVAKNTATALVFASTTKHRWNGKENNLLFVLLLCKYIHQGLSPISNALQVVDSDPGSTYPSPILRLITYLRRFLRCFLIFECLLQDINLASQLER